jgi:hypothetical protein
MPERVERLEVRVQVLHVDLKERTGGRIAQYKNFEWCVVV